MFSSLLNFDHHSSRHSVRDDDIGEGLSTLCNPRRSYRVANIIEAATSDAIYADLVCKPEGARHRSFSADNAGASFVCFFRGKDRVVHR